MSTSLTGKIKRFAGRILKKTASPLLQHKIHDPSPVKMPHRSRRIATQPLSKVPVARHGEVLVMQRLGELGIIQPGATEVSKEEYEAMITGHLGPSHKEAIRELFPDDDQPLRIKRRRGARA